MTWFKVDDSFYDHPKVYDAPDCAVALWTRAGCWSARNLTDGFVPTNMLARFCGDPDTAVRELVKRGLWSRSKGGYLFHDWRDCNPTREQVEEQRSARAEAGRKGGVASGKTRSKRRSKTEANASPTVEPPTRPVPFLPNGRKEGDGAPAAARAAPLETHPFVAAAYGECAECGLPAGNRRHIRLVGEAS